MAANTGVNRHVNRAYGFTRNALQKVFVAPIVANRAPATTDFAPIGTLWVEPTDINGTAVNSAWILTSIISNVATWILVESGGGAGVFSSLTVTPGPISLTGTTSINITGSAVTTIGTGGTGAVHIGNATGNTSITGTLTASAAITATTGNITASAGSVSATATGATVAIIGNTAGGTGATATLTSSGATVDALQLVVGGLKVPVTSEASGASPRIISARFGNVGFSDVIAAAATVALVITNTMVTSASIMLFGLSCSTAGAALVVRDYVPGSGTVTINITNLGGSDTSDDIFVTFWLLN